MYEHRHRAFPPPVARGVRRAYEEPVAVEQIDLNGPGEPTRRERARDHLLASVVRRLRLFAIVATVVLSFGCAQDPETLEVAQRLLAPTGEPKRGERHACAVGKEIRPARGCPQRVALRPLDSESPKRRRFRVDRLGLGRDLYVVKRFRPAAEPDWKSYRPQVIRNARKIVGLRFPEGAELVEAQAFLLPSARTRVLSCPMSVRPGALLQGGLALDPGVPAARSAPVEFRIVAHVDGRAELLYREVLPPDTQDPVWTDYELPLDDFTGKQLTLEFTTDFETPTDGPRVLAVPLWSQPAVVAPAEEPAWNFIVVSLDTLRADYIGAYGAPDGSTPVLDAVAAEGVTFERATTTFPSTTAAHMSLFTSLYPSVHEVRAPPAMLSRKIPTLAQLLASAGYRTAAVTENGMIVAHAGFVRGFDSYVEFKGAKANLVSGHVDRVVDVATAWLGEHRDERFFLFLHTYEAHSPFRPPPEFDRFAPPKDGRPYPRMRAAYRGGILYTDHELGRLMATLETLDLSRRTVLIVTSDHGEAFGEHGILGHGQDLTEELLHVPLLVRAPGLAPRGRRVGQPVSLVDVAPTILQLAGLTSPAAMQGRSLVAMLSGDDEVPPVPVYSEVGGAKSAPTVAVREGDLKWVFPGNEDPPRAFDLTRGEEAEMELRSQEALARGQALRAQFEAAVQERRLGRSSSRPPEVEIDATIEGQLRALGYVE